MEGVILAKQIEGVYESVIECAKKEFLKKGYKDASLRIIAQEANTSTGSIYTRFKDKEGLFEAIVAPVADKAKEIFINIQTAFHKFDEETQKDKLGQYTSCSQLRLLDYVYEYFDEFKLLVEFSQGTRFESFIDELIDIEVDYTYKYMEVINCQSVKSGVVTEEFVHIVICSYFNGMFEVVRHNMSKKDAIKYIKLLISYHLQGFTTIFDATEE